MSERIHTDTEREDAPPDEEEALPGGAPPDVPVRESGPAEQDRADSDAPAPTDATVAHEAIEATDGARLAAAEAKAEEHLADLRRLAADFDNYRKRAAREQASLVARAHERLVKELLPVLDDLERALDAANEHAEAQLEDGVRLVHRSLADLLRKEGLARIETDGAFDPHVHEALLSQPSEADEGTVIQVVQQGYRLGDRVLRPARVVVSAGSPDAEPQTRDPEPQTRREQ